MAIVGNGIIPLTKAEAAALEQLREEHGNNVTSVTRRDPGEKGPVLVHVQARTFQISRAGKVQELAD